MSWHELVERVAGVSSTEAIEQWKPALAAPWAQGHTGAIALVCIAIVGATTIFYLRLQQSPRRVVGLLLAVSRGALGCLLLLMLAEPTLVLRLVRHPQPLVYLLFDGTESMKTRDPLPSDERQRWAAAADVVSRGDESLSRIDLTKQLLTSSKVDFLRRLQAKYRLKAFLFEGPQSVRALGIDESGDPADRAPPLAAQLSTDGATTALGAALNDLASRHANSHLGAVIVFSDFDQNAGPSPLVPAQSLRVPLYAIGIGPRASVDLAVELDAPPVMKKSESASIQVLLRQQGLTGRSVVVMVSVQKDDGGTEHSPTSLGRQEIALNGPSTSVQFAYTPHETGRMKFIASAEPVADEVVHANNVAERETLVRDDFLRLMYVEHEPTWEWRFIKEVFHRDPLVGARGFRTFLRSADPKVRQTNELFLSSLAPQRSEFFANDVLLLGDLPEQMLTAQFCDRAKEFVGVFGGGMVVVSGPTFGPAALAQTPLADLLPVVVDRDAHRRDAREFIPQLTPVAASYGFMQLGSTALENRRAWANLAPLPWYQPVERVRDGAVVLLAHPTDFCSDGKTPQPIVALRPYGKGQVVYLAMNEMWRLRRKYGERYYRRFWGQLIYRLGLRHALGSQKRFVVRTDRESYSTGDEALITVEAFDENYEPLPDMNLESSVLVGKLVLPPRAPGETMGFDGRERPLSLGLLRPGVYATRVSGLVAGEYHAQITDPVTKTDAEVVFSVRNSSPERRSATRNVALQEQLAAATAGEACDLLEAVDLPDRINAVARPESSIEVIALGNTWMAFTCIVGLMLFEWFVRKAVHLP